MGNLICMTLKYYCAFTDGMRCCFTDEKGLVKKVVLMMKELYFCGKLVDMTDNNYLLSKCGLSQIRVTNLYTSLNLPNKNGYAGAFGC